jgi:hypothetical protein
MSYISFFGDSTYASVRSDSLLYRLHQRLDNQHNADSYYQGDGGDNRLTGSRWTFNNASLGGKTLFWLYDGVDDGDGAWGKGDRLASTVTSHYVAGTQHWVFIGGGLNDLLGSHATTEYADHVLALRYQIEADVVAAGMIPVQCELTPWGRNIDGPFLSDPNLAHNLVTYFNASLEAHCGTTVLMQDFYSPVADPAPDSRYWIDYRSRLGIHVHFSPLGNTHMASSVDPGALGLPYQDAATLTTLSGSSGSIVTGYSTPVAIHADLMAGTARLPDRSVSLEYSLNGISDWTTATAAVTQPVPGRYQAIVKRTTSLYLRFRFPGDSSYVGFTGPVVRLYPSAVLTTPIVPASARKARSFTVYGYLKPRHKSGTSPVRIYAYRLVSGTWRPYSYATARVHDYRSYSTYRQSLSLPHPGRWRLRAYAPSDAGHAASWSSGYDYVTVK